MNNFTIYRCYYIHGEKVIDTDKGKFFVTPKCNDKEQLFRFLEKRDFPFFLPIYKIDKDSYEIYPYCDDFMPVNDKAVDLIHVLSLLHIKTTSYQEVSIDSVKKSYESFLKKINSLEQYYHQLQEGFESHIYMAPAEYLFIRNVSLLYENLIFCKKYINQWYKIKSKLQRERLVLLHKKPWLSNFVDQKTPYFTHWDLAEKGYPIYDFLSFYQKHYLELEMSSLFQIYQSNFQFSEEENYLFYCLLLLQDRIAFSDNCFQNTVVVHQHIVYAFKVKEFILEQNQKNQETDESKFS